MPEQYDEDRLARIMRAGLHANADQAGDRLSRPVTSGHPPRTPWLLAVAAAVAVAVGVPLTFQALDGGGGGGGGDRRDQVVTDPAVPPAVPDDWRVESYGGIQVRVPPMWGWGGAWFHAPWEGDRVMDCGAVPHVVPGDPDDESAPEDSPYVGRPLMMSDVCSIVGLPNAPERPAPQADSVWIGAAVEPGTEDLGNGYVRETVRVREPTQFGDGTVSVTSDDPALRRQILATAVAVGVDAHGCRSDATWQEFPAGRIGDLEATSLSVCLYETYQGETTLIWSDRRSADDARQYVDQVEATSDTYDPMRFCTDQPDGQWLAVGAVAADGETAWTAVTMGGCAQILWHYQAEGDPESVAASPVNPETVAPWATPAVRAYVVGPVDWQEWADGGENFFRGYLG
jgi:hypothetical protein